MLGLHSTIEQQDTALLQRNMRPRPVLNSRRNSGPRAARPRGRRIPVQKKGDTMKSTLLSVGTLLLTITMLMSACGGLGGDGSTSDGTILDKVTGLMWQQKDDDTVRTWDDAGAYCTALSLAGHTDWRVPAKKELLSIVDYGKFSPAVDGASFPNTNVDAYYWTSTEYAADTSNVWFVEFDLGQSFNAPKTDQYYVRCVRGPSAAPDLADNGDGTVTDNGTGLMWQQADSGTAKTWEDAIVYCTGLPLAAYDDWRLPDIKELATLASDTAYSPAINTALFPLTPASSDYWSSTTDAHSTISAWRVTFDYGKLLVFAKTSPSLVRCVR